MPEPQHRIDPGPLLSAALWERFCAGCHAKHLPVQEVLTGVLERTIALWDEQAALEEELRQHWRPLSSCEEDLRRYPF